MVALFKTLGEENRLRILNILMHFELCVCELEVILNLSQSNVSRHLAKLKSIGIIRSSKDAQWIHYIASEKFVSENPHLIEYLNYQFQKDLKLQEDLHKCRVYKNSTYNCQTITNDRQTVADYIHQSI